MFGARHFLRSDRDGELRSKGWQRAGRLLVRRAAVND